MTRINGTRLGADRNSNHNFLWGGEETDPETRDEVVTKKDVVQLMQSKTKIA